MITHFLRKNPDFCRALIFCEIRVFKVGSYIEKENKVWLTWLSVGGRGVWELLHTAFIAPENIIGKPIMFAYRTEETTSLETFNASSLPAASSHLIPLKVLIIKAPTAKQSAKKG